MKEIKMTEAKKEALKEAFIKSANLTKNDFYNKSFEERKEGVHAFFMGALEAELKSIFDVDIGEAWEILRDTIYQC